MHGKLRFFNIRWRDGKCFMQNDLFYSDVEFINGNSFDNFCDVFTYSKSVVRWFYIESGSLTVAFFS